MNNYQTMFPFSVTTLRARQHQYRWWSLISTVTIFFIALLTLSTSSALLAHGKVDAKIPDYKPRQGISGNLTSIGSDTLANLMTLWSEKFKDYYPAINIQIQAAGSSTAPPALIEGTSNFGPMSRKMKDKESSAFEKRFGYKPTAVPVALDALVIFVNRDNPIKGLTIQQVDAIFSSTRRCGYSQAITNWGELGLRGRWHSRRIQLFGRNSASGTYGYFKKVALCKGDYRNNVNEQPGSASVVQSVATSIGTIGYSGIGYSTASVRALPLNKGPGSDFVEATATNAVNGKYPLARLLYIYINKHPSRRLSRLDAEFIRMVLSQDGQKIVVKDGYIPLPNTIVRKTLKELKLGQR